ncbi:MAG: LCP family protein [Pleurocapsa minor GSE-CHR-MK-17-07R]|nr:LCP family protein [Pleurocapsa minor GSE-CHR-MK 17-07R]
MRRVPADDALPPADPVKPAQSYPAYPYSTVNPGPIPPFEVPLDRVSAARVRTHKRRTRRYGGADWAWVIIAGALLSVVVVASLSVTLILRANGTTANFLPTAAISLPTAVVAQNTFASTSGDIAAGQQVTLDDGRSIVLQPWNGGSRLTILVMGLDRRPEETGLMYRTDTMMLVSLDRDTNSVGILSLPRDLWVDVPGYSELQRINSAMVLGELERPNYGPTLAMQTVQYNLGMYVHGYVAVDFEAVTTLIDLLGGVEIDVPYNIADYEYPDMNYGYDPLILQAGLQLMDGSTALKFARTRHGDNDFERARRQQMLVYALRDRILDFNLLPQLIVQSPTLLNSLSNNLYTNLTLDQLIQVAVTVKDVPGDAIRTGVIDGSYIMPYTTAAGAQVLVPRRAMLGELLSNTFGQNYSG